MVDLLDTARIEPLPASRSDEVPQPDDDAGENAEPYNPDGAHHDLMQCVSKFVQAGDVMLEQLLPLCPCGGVFGRGIRALRDDYLRSARLFWIIGLRQGVGNVLG